MGQLQQQHSYQIFITNINLISCSSMQTKSQNHHQSQPNFQPKIAYESDNQFMQTCKQSDKSRSDHQIAAQHQEQSYQIIVQSITEYIKTIAREQETTNINPLQLIFKIGANHIDYHKQLWRNKDSTVQTGGQLNHQHFWQTNQNLQRQLEQQLRDLKTLDNVIDNIVNEEFDKCNEIDQIQQTIRLILSKKDEGHIAKAEPYYQQKQICLDSLNEKKDQKDKIKVQKYNQVRKILNLLQQLRRHRQSGLKSSLSEGRDKKLSQAEQGLLERAINDIKQVQKNQNYLINLQTETKDLTGFIADMQRRIDEYAKQLLNFIDQQNQACQQLSQIARLKAETQYFQTSIFSLFGLSNLRKVPKRDFAPSLQNAVTKLQRYSKQNKQKQKQTVKIEQGIETTKRTISIFEHILQKIKTQNSRKKLLLSQIEKIQTKHEQQQKILNTISQNQNEFEKMKLNKNQLNKHLDNKMNQANVVAYKNIHDQIQKVQSELKVKEKKIQALKLTASQNARRLYDQTMGLQQEYEDILSQIVPSLWLKGSDFTKQQAIKDLNLYLLKTFKRLSIAD